MIFVYTGNGKGKTTAAIGQGIRAEGQGKKVLLLQFIKSEGFFSGEEKIIRTFGTKFRLIKGGKGYVGILGDKLDIKEHRKAAEETLKIAEKEIKARRADLIILDEINIALSLKLIKISDVLRIIKKAGKDLDIILTGRGAPRELIEIADLVTECREIKHYFKKNHSAKKGIEY